MIAEKDLQEAIAECNKVKNPTANTCLKLAAYYTILDHVRQPTQSFSADPYVYSSDSEFGKCVEKVGIYRTMEVMEELVATLKMINPRLYNSVLREMEGK